MASETVDPIDWPLPSTLYRPVAVYPERHLTKNQCNLGRVPSSPDSTAMSMRPLREYLYKMIYKIYIILLFRAVKNKIKNLYK